MRVKEIILPTWPPNWSFYTCLHVKSLLQSSCRYRFLLQIKTCIFYECIMLEVWGQLWTFLDLLNRCFLWSGWKMCWNKLLRVDFLGDWSRGYRGIQDSHWANSDGDINLSGPANFVLWMLYLAPHIIISNLFSYPEDHTEIVNWEATVSVWKYQPSMFP